MMMHIDKHDNQRHQPNHHYLIAQHNTTPQHWQLLFYSSTYLKSNVTVSVEYVHKMPWVDDDSDYVDDDSDSSIYNIVIIAGNHYFSDVVAASLLLLLFLILLT